MVREQSNGDGDSAEINNDNNDDNDYNNNNDDTIGVFEAGDVDATTDVDEVGDANDDNDDDAPEVDTSHLENPEDVDVQVDPDDVEVTKDHGRVNKRVVASVPKTPFDARKAAENLGHPDRSEDGSIGGFFDGTRTFDDDRNLPVHNATEADDGTLDTDEKQFVTVQSTTRKRNTASLYGRAVRVEDVGPRHPDDRELYLADEDGTTKIRLYGAFGVPEIRAGDQVVAFNLDNNDDDGGHAWEQTEHTVIVVLAASMHPPGYHLEHRSRLIKAKSWYEVEDDVEATRLVKVTLEDEFDLETPRGQGDSPDTYMYVDDPDDELHGTWTRLGDTRIRELLEEHLPERKVNQRTKNSIMCSIRDRTRVPEDEWEPGAPKTPRLKWMVGVENGVIDLRTGELLDHSPEWKIRQKLPVEYHPDEYDGLGEVVNEFLQETMQGDEDIESVLYMIGHALARCYPTESIWSFIGGGNNGKTVLLSVLDALFGDALGDFKISLLSGDNDFGGGALVGSNIVVDDDATSVKLSHTSDLKKQSGGRGGSINQKHEKVDGDLYRNFGTLVLVANDAPVWGDKTEGMKRRMYPVIMPYEFTDDPTDDHKTARNKDDLIADLTSDEELEALLVVAAQYAQRIFDTGSVEDGRTKDERTDLYDNFSDSMQRFWGECMVQQSGARLSTSAVYATAVQWCEANGKDPWNSGGTNGFWQLSDQCPTISYNRGDVYVNGDRAVEHVTFSEDAIEYAPDWVLDEWETQIESDEDDELGNRLDSATPLEDLDAGYCTVEAQVISIAPADPAEGRGAKLTLEDNTTAIDVVTWEDEFDKVSLGDEVRLTRVVLAQHSGVPQLKSSAAMEVEVVERGDANDVPGENAFIDDDDAGDSDETRDSALDETIDTEGPRTDAEERIYETVQSLEGEHDKGVPQETVFDELVAETDADHETYAEAGEELMNRGNLYEPKTGRWRCT